MVYVNLDDNYPEHPKVTRLSDGAFRLHTAAICYCSRLLTDGRIQAIDVPRLVPRYRRTALAELVAAGLWLESGDGYYFELHDYLDWNKSRRQVETEKDRAKQRRARYRGRQEDE